MKTIFKLSIISSLFLISSCGDEQNASSDSVLVKSKTYEERLQETESKIRNNPDWVQSIEKKAKENNISTDSMIHADARWMIDEEDGKHKNINQPAPVYDVERLKKTEEKIRGNADWLKTEEKKAKENNISTDSMISVDAKWTIDEEDGKHKPSEKK